MGNKPTGKGGPESGPEPIKTWVGAAAPLRSGFGIDSFPPETKELQFDDIKPGMGGSFPYRVEEFDVVQFARASGDENPLHLDPQFAAKTMFKERIAHGMLPASFIEASVEKVLRGTAEIKSLDLRFSAPVFFAKEITTNVRVTEVLPKTREVKLSCECVVDGKTVLSGELTIEKKGERTNVSSSRGMDLDRRGRVSLGDDAVPASFEDLIDRFNDKDAGRRVAWFEKVIFARDIQAFRGIMGQDSTTVPLTMIAGYLSAIFGTKFPGAGAIYLSQTLNSVAPIRPGDEVKVAVRIEELIPNPKGDRVRFYCEATVIGRIAASGEAVLMIPTKPQENTI